jgi:ubiquinone/menaquinone biosynthesis C-methylase UbiE
VSTANPDHQRVVDSYFDREASYWHEVYRDDGLQGLVYRRRMETVLAWIDSLRLAAGAPVLDVGCGAGLLSLALADRGLAVTATDSSQEMVDLVARQALERNAVGVSVQRADAHALPFPASQFQLVVALGLLPWLHDAGVAVREMSRVLAPDGWMIVTADNRSRLNFVLEPRENPLLTPVRLVRGVMRRGSEDTSAGAPSYRHLPAEIDRMLALAHVQPVRRATVGFGPFTFLGRRVLPDASGTALHARLERASADRATLRRLGWHYVVAGRKVD